MPRSFLTEARWEQLGPLLPPEPGGMERPRFSNRLRVEAILWKHRTGAPWRDLPEDFRPWTSVYTRFNTWIHLLCDALGNPLDFVLTPGQAGESRAAQTLLNGWQAKFVLGDRAYAG